MSHKAFDLMLKLMEMRKDRSVAKSRKAQADFLSSKNISDQLKTYATEYDAQWVRAAQQGDSVMMLHTSASFGQNLNATAATQSAETRALEKTSQRALQQAMQDSQRIKVLQDYIARRKALTRKALEGREQRQLEDDLNGRRREP
jgi:flagellar biosynthesis chaperone FliJ